MPLGALAAYTIRPAAPIPPVLRHQPGIVMIMVWALQATVYNRGSFPGFDVRGRQSSQTLATN
jgi:hypothetical protein